MATKQERQTAILDLVGAVVRAVRIEEKRMLIEFQGTHEPIFMEISDHDTMMAITYAGKRRPETH